MFVPLPPFLTFRASYLIEDSRDSAYWHAVFEAEWVTLVLSRWCADILQRGIIRRLPGQARAGIDTMGIVKLLRDSPWGGPTTPMALRPRLVLVGCEVHVQDDTWSVQWQ
jgi:hypothetical protein